MTELDATATDKTPTLAPEGEQLGLLVKQFPFLAGQVTVQRARRVWIEVPKEALIAVLVFAKDSLGYDTLCTITGTDEGAELGLLYHLAHPRGTVLTLVTTAEKDGPGPSTVTPYFPLAEIYEREIVDLLGVEIEGLSEGFRYPLPDGWPEGQYPLRKDWKPPSAHVSSESSLDDSREKENRK